MADRSKCANSGWVYSYGLHLFWSPKTPLCVQVEAACVSGFQVIDEQEPFEEDMLLPTLHRKHRGYADALSRYHLS